MKYIIIKNRPTSSHFNDLAQWSVYDNEDGQLVAQFTTMKRAKAMVAQWLRYLG